MTVTPTDPMIGRLIDGRYQVRSRIARGGMATVYLATDLRLERRVAIKIMHGHLADDSKFKERFIQEARSAARLAHPNVVNVFDQGQDSDMAYLVMEYLPGITLRDLLQDNGRLTTDQTLDILEAVLSGLSAAHKAGIVHRDLKPENVLLADDGRIKIGDFGLARAASANTATGAALLGTIAYLSPELVTRGIADARSDIYAVGIMTYEMLTGEQPFKGEQPMQIAYQHANDSVPSPGLRNPKVPVELDELVLWATARDADERPRDARAMLDEVMVIQSEIVPPGNALTSTIPQRTMVLPGTPPTRNTTKETQVLSPARRNTGPIVGSAADRLAEKSRRRRGRGWWIAALIVVLVALAGGTGWYFGSGPGAAVTIPDVSGKTLSAARAELSAAGFDVSGRAIHQTDPRVPKDRVKGTTPDSGSPAGKGALVRIILSDGPKLIDLPELVGKQEAAARDAITSAGFTVASKKFDQFSSKYALGTIIDALDENGTSLTSRQTYPEQRPIKLVVSAGPLPSVKGDSLDAAILALHNAGLEATQGAATYNDDVAKGDVIGIDKQSVNGTPRVFRVGDKGVLLITSKGPTQVAVPNVIGEKWSVAKAALLKLGFTLDYNKVADTLGGTLAVVESVTPGFGETVDKGTSLKVTFTASF